jgi:hypothetical protein
MVTVATVLLVLVGPAASARKPLRGAQDELARQDGPKSRGAAVTAPVPLPRPRPVEAPGARPGPAPDGQAEPGEGAKEESKEQPRQAARPAEPAAPEPSACRRALTDELAVAPSIPDIRAPGGCGGEDLVRLEAVVLADKRRVAVTPAATLRCTMALAITEWVRTDVAPLATALGSPLSALDNFDSYECRGRNRVVGAPLSEHGRANALDVRAFKLADGRSVGLTDRTVPRDLRESVLRSVCARFVTVLGPGSDWYHEDHIHLDLMERRNSNFRICQWNVWEPLPQVAPLLPAERPEEAPPREVAAAPADARPEAEPDTKSKAARDGNEPDAAESDDRASAPPKTASQQKADRAAKHKSGRHKSGRHKSGEQATGKQEMGKQPTGKQATDQQPATKKRR